MEQRSVIFDIFGVLFFVRIQAILQHVGLGQIFFYTVRNGRTPFRTFFTILDKMRKELPGEFQESVTFRGYYLPKSICDWQRGKIPSKEMLNRLTEYINQLQAQEDFFKTEKAKKVVIRAAQAAFDPRRLIEACVINEPVAQAVKRLKEQDYTLYVLSNVDEDIYSELNNQHPHFFEQFNGIVTSYETHYLKPEKEIYLYLIDQYKLEPLQCCFIDDQKENVKAAQDIGMKGFVYKKGENVIRRINKVF